MPAKSSSASGTRSNAGDGWYAHAEHGPERTSRTDDQHIEAVMPLPPPEHLIRFFPIAGSPVERLI
ncbi:MAG TPA: hypothetical protein VFG60_02470, partial [Burkholderiaceae bacterium]|nr:hypothetical protein [Burkholderiaceae bacterium]